MKSDIKSNQGLVSNLSFKKNFLWTLLGYIVYAGSQWGMIVAIAKLSSTENVGKFALALAVVTPIMMFTNMHLRAVQVTDAKREHEFVDYLRLRILSLLFSAVILVVAISILDFRNEIVSVTWLIFFVKVFENISDIYYGAFQQIERMDVVGFGKSIKGILSLILFIIILFYFNDIQIAVFSWLFAMIGTLFVVDIVLFRKIILMNEGINYVRKLFSNIKIDKVLPLIKLSLPLGIIAMLLSYRSNIPKYVIEYNFGEGQLGIYAALSYLMVAMGTITNALGQSASPRLSKYFAFGDMKRYVKLLLKLMSIGFVIGIVGYITSIYIGGDLLMILYGKEYAEYLDVFLILIIATAISSVGTFLGYGLTSARLFTVQLPLILFVTIVTGIMSYMVIPSKGIMGAAIVLIIASSLQIIGASIILFYNISIKMKII